MELQSSFKEFLANIEPTSNQKEDASKGHITLRSRLEKDEEYKTHFKDSFLSGSYGRDTAIRPIKDVDIIIVTNYSDKLEPKVALSYLKSILSKYYQNVTTQNRSIHVALSYVEMDIVPSISASGDFLQVPDRAVQKWVLSHPQKHLKATSEMNAAKNGLYVPLVKVLKRWRDNHMKDSWKPTSFLLECLAYEYARTHSLDSIPKAVEDCIWSFYYKYEINLTTKNVPFISDIGGTGNDIAKKWTFEEFEKFVTESKASWHIANRALKSENVSESANLWRQLLGDAFPSL